LACSACGAPLHDLKMLRKDHADAPEHELIRPSKIRAKPGKAAQRPAKPRKKKPRKSFGRRLFEEAFDVIEDIFD